MGGKYILEATGIDKAFSGVTVLKRSRLCIEPGELHALMGERCRKIYSYENYHGYLYKRRRKGHS